MLLFVLSYWTTSLCQYTKTVYVHTEMTQDWSAFTDFWIYLFVRLNICIWYVPCMVYLLCHGHIVTWKVMEYARNHPHQPERAGDGVSLQHCGTGIHLKPGKGIQLPYATQTEPNWTRRTWQYGRQCWFRTICATSPQCFSLSWMLDCCSKCHFQYSVCQKSGPNWTTLLKNTLTGTKNSRVKHW